GLIVRPASSVDNTPLPPGATTDRPGYQPGETVVITGQHWEPGETVTMVLTEDPKICEDRTLTSVADADGNFTNTDFSPEAHNTSVTFTLTAIGAVSGGTAQAQFTNGSPTHAVTEVTPFAFKGDVRRLPAPMPISVRPGELR